MTNVTLLMTMAVTKWQIARRQSDATNRLDDRRTIDNSYGAQNRKAQPTCVNKTKQIDSETAQ